MLARSTASGFCDGSGATETTSRAAAETTSSGEMDESESCVAFGVPEHGQAAARGDAISWDFALRNDFASEAVLLSTQGSGDAFPCSCKILVEWTQSATYWCNSNCNPALGGDIVGAAVCHSTDNVLSLTVDGFVRVHSVGDQGAAAVYTSWAAPGQACTTPRGAP